MPPIPDPSNSPKRIFELLRCFSIDQPELSVSELSRKLGVHKSTTSRLLAKLVNEKMVTRLPETGRFRLGIGLLELAGRVTLHADLRQIARPIMRRLCEQTQETVNLAILEGNESVNLEQALPIDRHMSAIGWIGRRAPLHASSTGKVLLAYLPDEQIELQLSNPFQSLTPHTITTPAALRQELALIRHFGYAKGIEELEIGLSAVAAPIYDHTQKVVAALSVTAPSPRLTLAQIETQTAPMVVKAALEISRISGYFP